MADRVVRFEPLTRDVLSNIGKGITVDVDAMPTPFETWNGVCGEEGGRIGLARTWSVVIGGADGSGKSYLAINLAANAVKAGRKVGFVNFEMTRTGLAQRYLAILSGVPKYKLEHGEWFDESMWLEAQDYAQQVYEETGGVMLTNDVSVFNIDDIGRSYDALADQGCSMVVVDYAQLITVPGRPDIYGRSEAVAEELRVLSHRHNVQSLILSQMNREGKTGTKTSRHFLQGGGVWENNANQIALIDLALDEYDPRLKTRTKRIIIDKNRHGLAPVEIPVTVDCTNMVWFEREPELGMGDAGAEVDTDTGEIF